ncbi:histidine kinase [Streptomyces rimosus subsp. pseudoverticillatus]|uniref:DUF4118 domain-containing protein n=1 Tax=Streptomyces rimosus TaxID=1927 RepID=UPI0006B28774|nr:DUF4118 domain-containing protein [Streptomyces rimosus]KOT90152.1 histidine kinase [Streptomyces rimosus subsp. pseudoverticillatus]
MGRYLNRDRIALVAAMVGPLAVAAVLLLVRSRISNTDVALVLVVVVVGVAALGYRSAGLLAALSSAVWFDFFFTRPYQRLAITGSQDVRTAVLLVLVGAAVTEIAVRARRLKEATVEDAHCLALVHDTAKLAQSAGSADQVVEYVRGQLVELLGLRGCRFEYGSLLGRPPRMEQDGTLVVAGKQWDVERRGLPDEEIELRAFGNGHYCGRFLLRPVPGAKPPLKARLVAVTLADQTGAALDTSAG